MIDITDRREALIGIALSSIGGLLAWQLLRALTVKRPPPPPIAKIVKVFDYQNVPKKWVIFGGAGALGDTLIRHLVNSVQGVESVTSFDLNHSSLQSPLMKSMKGSVLDKKAVEAAIQGCDVIVLAFTPRIHSATWNQFVSINVGGVQTVLNAAQSQGGDKPRSVVYISSTAIYNHYADHDEVDESFPLPTHGEYETAYDLTKRLGEDLVIQANGMGGLRTIALRPSGILIGPADYTLEAVLKQNISAVEGKPIDYTYGLNVCHAVVLAAGALGRDPSKVSGRALLISKGKPASPGQVVRDLDKMVGGKVNYLPLIILRIIYLSSTIKAMIDSVRDPARSVAIPTHRFLVMADKTQTFDNSLAKDLLGFEPLYSYEEGLTNIAAEYLESLKLAV